MSGSSAAPSLEEEESLGPTLNVHLVHSKGHDENTDNLFVRIAQDVVAGVGLVNRSEATVMIRFLDTVNRLTAHPTQYI